MHISSCHIHHAVSRHINVTGYKTILSIFDFHLFFQKSANAAKSFETCLPPRANKGLPAIETERNDDIVKGNLTFGRHVDKNFINFTYKEILEAQSKHSGYQ